MQYGPDKVPISNVSILVGPPTYNPAPVPSTTTEEILEPPVYEPLVDNIAGAGNVIPPAPPYAVSVTYGNALITPKVFDLNFNGAGVLVVNNGDGTASITISGEPIGGYVIAGNGIDVSTSNGVSTVTNTGVLNVGGGTGISASTLNGVVTVTNTGILSVSAGNGMSVATLNGNVTVTNTGVLNVVAGNSISVSTVNGNATVNNTFTETVYSGGSWSGSVIPNRANGTIQKYTLTGNITLNTPSNISAGQSLTLILTQDGAGSRLLTANAAYKFASSFKTLSAGAGAIDMLNMFYDGTTYYVTLTVGYA